MKSTDVTGQQRLCMNLPHSFERNKIHRMKNLNPYLTFNGNCREAMEFYKNTLNGELPVMMTFGEAPIEFPEETSDRIFNSVLVTENVKIMASDVLDEVKLQEEQRFSLFLTLNDAKEHERLFQELSDQGKILMPLQDGFGMLRDKYGIQWMIVLEPDEKENV